MSINTFSIRKYEFEVIKHVCLQNPASDFTYLSHIKLYQRSFRTIRGSGGGGDGRCGGDEVVGWGGRGSNEGGGARVETQGLTCKILVSTITSSL